MGTFPFRPNRFFFDDVLVSPGDYIRTFPLNRLEKRRFMDAAGQWAWYNKYTIKNKSFKVAPDQWEVECTLVSKYRERDFG